MELDFKIVIGKINELVAGAWITLGAFGLSLSIGLSLSLILLFFRYSSIKPFIFLAKSYVSFFRAIPELVLIFWMFYCIPSTGIISFSGFFTGSLALGLVAGAFLSEIFRASINSVKKGQWEAAHALGIPGRILWIKVVLPQAARLAIPPFVNYLTELLKATTLLATIGVGELALKAYVLGAQTFRYLEFLTAIAVMYFIIIYPLAYLAKVLEKKLQRSYT